MSGTGHGNDRIDALRKLATVAVLVLGVVLLHRYGTGGDELPTTAMLALGFVVLASYTFGELVGVVKLPHITGYLLAGVLLGPSAAGWAGDLISSNIPPPFALDHIYHGKPDGGVLSTAVQEQLAPFSTLAIALIAMTAGGELRIESLRKGFKTLLGVLGGQIAIIVPVMVLFVFAISGQFGSWLAMPFTTPTGSGGMALGGLSILGVLLIGGVVASISIATSPAATIAVINGTRAKGPLTQSVLSAVVLKDVVVVLLFSILAAVAAVVISPADLQMPEEYVKAAQVEQAGDHHGAHGATTPHSHATDPTVATNDAPSTHDDNGHAADGHAADGHAADGHAADGHAPDTANEHKAPPTVGAFTATLAWHILGSLTIGLLIGLLVAAYLRFIGVEILLFLVAMVFAVAYVGSAIGLDTTLVFIAAGFAATNFSKEGERLIHEVELLGTPVYVIFFTMTGAHLDLTALVSLLPYVIPLVAVRTFAIWFGVRAGTAVMGAPEPVKKHAWMGFISQAGVAIALAGLVGGQFGDAGLTLQALIIAGVAVHEVIGPVALKAALGLAKEIPGASDEQHVEDAAGEDELPPPERLQAWTPPEDVEDPWGVTNKSVSPAMDEVQDDLRDDLVALVRDVEQGHLAEWASDARDYLDALRREFLRHHRRVSIAVSDERGDATLQARAEMAALADRWRDLVLARSAEVANTTWSPMAVSEAVDELANRVPDSIDAAFEPESLRGTEADSAIWAVRRTAFRLAHNAQAAVTGTVPLRRVPVRDVVRYHMSGLLPGRLEGLAALLISGEQHLNQRTRSLFTTVNSAYEALIEASAPTSERDPHKLLGRIRHRIEEEFVLARDEVAAIIDDGALRTARILGQSWRDVVDDMPRIATLDLPRRSRRYSKVFRERARGLTTLDAGLRAARKSTAARYDSLALDLEIVRLEGRVRDLVDQHGQALARNVRGKGATQVIRVEGALRDALTAVESILSEEHTASELAAALRATCEPLDHIAEDAARSASQLHDQLSDEQALTPLLDALLVAARDLTDRYTIPVGPERSGDWSLPPPTATTEVPFRDIVRAFVETAVTRKLTELTRALADNVRELATTLDDFDRLVAFNVELATGELDLVDGPVSDSVRELVHEMIVGNLTRARGRLESVRDGSEGWAKSAEEAVSEAVLGGLDTLRAQVQEGKVSELRVRLLREAAAGRRLVKRAGGLRGIGNSLGEAIADIAKGTLGTAGVTRAQRALGLPLTAEELRPDPSTFAELQPTQDLPMVYRRLFSDIAMDTGDLITGRKTELDRGRRVLDGELGGRLRSVALVGPAGVGKRALVSALVRKVHTRDIHRIVLDAPVTTEEVQAWFETKSRDRLIAVEGLQWLFATEPDGMNPLRAFAQGLIKDDGKNRWLLHAHSSVWQTANRVAGLSDAFAEVIELQPLGPEALAQAILARHSMSGYELRFDGDPGLSFQLRTLFRPSADALNRPQEAWFAALHDSTGGLLNDALRLWMAAIVQVDEARGVVVVGDLPEGAIEAMRSLPDQDLLTLRQIARQGTMRVATHSWLFRTSLVASQAHLGHLAHLGLLEPRGDCYALADHLRGSITRVLQDRGWSE